MDPRLYHSDDVSPMVSLMSKAGSACTRRHALHLSRAGLAAAFVPGATHAAQAGDLPTLEANKALVRRLFDEAVNDGRLDVIDEAYAKDFVDRRAWPDQLAGPAGITQSVSALLAIVPGIEVRLEALVAEGDLVATRERWYGPHPPAGMHLLGATLHLFRLEDGQIVEEWSAGWDWVANLPTTTT